MAIVTGEWAKPYSFKVVENTVPVDPEKPVDPEEPTTPIYTHREEALLSTLSVNEEDWFGYTVDISADGSRAVVGAHKSDETQPVQAQKGRVYIFSRSGSNWVLETTLRPDAETFWFGEKVKISGDGLRVVVGAPASRNQDGIIFIYVKTGASWVLEQSIYASDESGYSVAYFGADIDITHSGSYMVVGAPYRSVTPYTNIGFVYVYKRSGSSWIEEAILQPTSTGNVYSYGKFGTSVAINPEGTLLAIGAIEQSTDSSGDGRVVIYRKNGATWVEETTIRPSPALNNEARFGQSVDFSNDGTVLVVGAPWERYISGTTYYISGRAYVYKYNGVSWVKSATLPASLVTTHEYQGWEVAISGDGKKIVVGAYGAASGSLTNAGKATVYIDVNGVWTPQPSIFATDKEKSAQYGRSVAMAKDGHRIIAGAHYATLDGMATAGKAYVSSIG